MNAPALNNPALTDQTLELRDIHLPEAISWWPIAPGWWMIVASVILVFIILFISRKIYSSRRLKREISAELETIKQQFQATQDKSQLAKSLSVLLRRSCITYYPSQHIAGLTGRDWLSYLDTTMANSAGDKRFHSDIGQALLDAPYLPEDTELDYDAQALIQLCQSWLSSSHKNSRRGQFS